MNIEKSSSYFYALIIKADLVFVLWFHQFVPLKFKLEFLSISSGNPVYIWLLI